jgi:site-specific DNA-methyltransferase (adenine-specific)
MKSGAAQKYETMSVYELCTLPIKNIAEKNCVLFLWATTPMLPEAMVVMQAWGFKYKTAIYWHKVGRLGLGYWFRGQVELCLVGVRGRVKAFRRQKANVIQSKVRLHSQKPEEFFHLIEPVAPSPRIELFARGEPRDGWHQWGREIDSADVFSHK